MALILKGAHVVDPQAGIDGVVDVAVADGRIAQVAADIQPQDGDQVRDLSGKYLVPGLVDLHVHFRDPGYEHKEDIETGSRAAAHGGFTAVCTMANTMPVTDSADAVEYVASRGREVGKTRVYPAGACTVGLKGEALAEMGSMVERGAVAFTDDGRGIQEAGMMRRVMDYAKMFDKPVMSHCQDESLVGAGQVNEGVASTRLGLLGWPAAGEEVQIARDCALAELTGCPLHIQHITSARGLDIVRQFKDRNVSVTCEVTPHHLALTEDDITQAYETALKVNPPLRTEADRQALVAAVADGTIDCIVTDHAPHAAWEKAREFELAPFGMTGLETSLAVILTTLVHPGVIGYARMVELMSVNPRKILRLDPVSIAPGNVADITVFDPEVEWTVTEDFFESRSQNSGFVGRTLKGRATDVYLGGKATMVDGAVCD